MGTEDPMDELWLTELQFLIEEVKREDDWQAQLRRIEDAYSIMERKADEVFERTGYYMPEMANKMNALRALILILQQRS